MLDRFLEYVRRSILRIEKQSGRKINVETDVALCYFLLKNEPYVTEAIGAFLSKLKRGDFVLHGAGASLQGKERDYIFYFWDITRYNLGAFAQGDEETKRRGELNVLMSRPKKKAIHYLHHGFQSLDHSKSNITQYLAKTLREKGGSSAIKAQKQGGVTSFTSQLLQYSIQRSGNRGLVNLQKGFFENALELREKIIVGDDLKSVDLVVFRPGDFNSVLGLVDLNCFSSTEGVGEDVIDYYFQLKRAQPAIDPVFMFSYELLDENGFSFQSLTNKLNKLL